MNQRIIEQKNHPAEAMIKEEADKYFRERYPSIYKIASQVDYIAGAERGYELAIEETKKYIEFIEFFVELNLSDNQYGEMDKAKKLLSEYLKSKP